MQPVSPDGRANGWPVTPGGYPRGKTRCTLQEVRWTPLPLILFCYAVALPEVGSAQPKGRPRVSAQGQPSKQNNKDRELPKVVDVQEDKEGVRSYRFEAVEVEGRLRSPQVLYFLRRVRAELRAGALGHRSFMRELRDTRRHSSLR